MLSTLGRRTSTCTDLGRRAMTSLGAMKWQVLNVPTGVMGSETSLRGLCNGRSACCASLYVWQSSSFLIYEAGTPGTASSRSLVRIPSKALRTSSRTSSDAISPVTALALRDSGIARTASRMADLRAGNGIDLVLADDRAARLKSILLSVK